MDGSFLKKLLFHLFFYLFCLFLPAKSKATEPVFYIREKKSSPFFYKRSTLLLHPALTKVLVKKDPAYQDRSMTYLAIPFYKLLNQETTRFKVNQNATLDFSCSDGFSAVIKSERVLNRSSLGSIAYLAVEPEEERWPPLKSSEPDKTAGPFYLIWSNPELSQVSREEWPFQLKGLEIQKSLEDQYPRIIPSDQLPQSSSIRKGFEIFKKNCFVCHTFNLQGRSALGPDLNIPMSPLEYYKKSVLKKFIRNPQSVRHWPLDKMKGFSPSEISDSELQDLLDYFNHMKKKRKSP